MNVLIEFQKTAFCWRWQITEHDLYSFFYSLSSLVAMLLCRVSFFSNPIKQHTPTTWVRRTKILSSSDMLQTTQNLLWQLNPGLIISACLRLTLSFSPTRISGRMVMVAARKLAKGTVNVSHTLIGWVIPTHPLDVVGRISIPDFCLVFEKQSQWVVAASGVKS